jgi:predicted DNA-binding transcriptional regulator YafY
VSTKGYVSRTRGKQVVRVLTIIALMQSEYWSTRCLALKCKVSPRTIRRDLVAIRYAGIRLKPIGNGCYAWRLACERGKLDD